jgi:hypothetical protein
VASSTSSVRLRPRTRSVWTAASGSDVAAAAIDLIAAAR